MKIAPVLFGLCCYILTTTCTFTASAQYYDSIVFVNSKWKIEKISNGIKLYSKHFNTKNLFRSNQYVSYIVVKKRVKNFAMAAEPAILKTVSDFANANDAIAAVNGNFFDTKNGGAVDYTKVNGQVININKGTDNKRLAFHQKAAVVIENGKPDILKWDGFANWEDNLKQKDVMLNGPLLVYNKVSENLDSTSSFNLTRHPRTAFGITKRGKIIMLVADGRHINAQGFSLYELTKIMRWLGCTKAINFDGGGSSTLWVEGKGVVNHPSDNAKWDNAGERKVANILFLKKEK